MEGYLYIHKEGGTSAVNLEKDMSIGLVETSLDIDGGVKTPYTNDRYDESGADVYIPTSGLKLKAYDAQYTLCYKGKGDGAFETMEGLRENLLKTGGALLMIYDSRTGKGASGAYLKSFSNPEYAKMEDGSEVLKFQITFRVTKPDEELKLTVNSDGSAMLSVK